MLPQSSAHCVLRLNENRFFPPDFTVFTTATGSATDTGDASTADDSAEDISPFVVTLCVDVVPFSVDCVVFVEDVVVETFEEVMDEFPFRALSIAAMADCAAEDVEYFSAAVFAEDAV